MDITQYSLFNNMRHSIESRYFFPNIDVGLAEVEKKLVQIDAYYPEYLSTLCIPETYQTQDQKVFLEKFARLRRHKNCVRTVADAYIDSLDLVEVGIVSPNTGEKLEIFFSRLTNLDIEFQIVGLGGGGSNANRIFYPMRKLYTCVDYDKVEVHNIPRLWAPRLRVNKADTVSNGKEGKFDITTNKRTLIYSGVDYHDRQTVCDNPNLLAVQVGFTDDKCIMSVNPENVGIFSGDTYGTINTHTMMLNAYRGVDVFLDWFLALTDEQIESFFTESTVISEFSILDDAKVNEKLFLEPIRKRSIIPTFIDYKGEPVRITQELPRGIVNSTLNAIASTLSSSYGFDYSPMYKLPNDDFYEYKVPDVTCPPELCDCYCEECGQNYPGAEPNCPDCESYCSCDSDSTGMPNNTSVFYGDFTSELLEGTLETAILEAAYRSQEFADTFLGVILSVDNTLRVNLLHPLTAAKVLNTLDRSKTYKFWFYMSNEPMDGTPYHTERVDMLDKIIAETLDLQQPDDEEEVVVIDLAYETGDIVGACKTYNGIYILGLDSILYNGVEVVPYYGYMLGNMQGCSATLTEYRTGNVSADNESTCTGDADNRLFSSRHRQHHVNPLSTYYNYYTPKNVLGGVLYSINLSLDLYFDKLGLNDE